MKSKYLLAAFQEERTKTVQIIDTAKEPTVPEVDVQLRPLTRKKPLLRPARLSAPATN